MFIQVIQGKCSARSELRELLGTWRDAVGDPPGWLGGTFGFTDDDQFVGVVRFESRELAMSNSDSEAQTAFAERMSGLFDGPVEFHDYDDVTVWLDGGSDDAGFVQVIQGRVEDPAEVKEAMGSAASVMREMRPEVIGGTFAVQPDGSYTQTVAFTDEASAREGEKLERPQEMSAAAEAMFADATFLDLREVWFESPS